VHPLRSAVWGFRIFTKNIYAYVTLRLQGWPTSFSQDLHQEYYLRAIGFHPEKNYIWGFGYSSLLKDSPSGHWISPQKEIYMGLRHPWFFVTHGSSSAMGFRHASVFHSHRLRHPWVFVTHGSSSAMGLRQASAFHSHRLHHPWIIVTHGSSSAMGLCQASAFHSHGLRNPWVFVRHHPFTAIGFITHGSSLGISLP
jgi:hypothetical protein